MPIQRVNERVRMPTLGKIRLGVRVESDRGSMYPKNVEYFVLKDAPEVEKVYGANPKEIDIMFPSDNLEEIIPTWLKWFSGGVKDRDGNITGGKLMCVGNGPDTKGNPGIADFYSKRDGITRVVPQRQCLGEKCPDWLDGKGHQQCKPSMKVLALIPLVSFYGVFVIDTTSWNSIQDFHSMLSWVRDRNNGVVRGIMFKIVREETDIRYFDAKEGKEKVSHQFIMRLKPNEEFLQKYGQDMAGKIQSAFHASDKYLLPSPADILHEPMEDNFQSIPVEQTIPAEQHVKTAEDLVGDAEIKAAFDELEKLEGKSYTQKARILAVRKKEGESDVKTAVLSTIKGKISEISARKQAPVQEGIM